MARWYCRRKATADESCKLRMSYLKKRCMLSAQNTERMGWVSSNTGKETNICLTVDITTNEPYARLVYAVTDRDGNKTDYDYEVSLVTTPCNWGGVRYWFGCPDCGRRVAVLYLVPGDVYFRCRNCNNLSYWSRNRCTLESFGHTDREIKKLRSEINRWTWRGRPTRKVRKLHALEQKIGIISSQVRVCLDKLKARIRRT
jgi:hypothetical protein